MDLWSLPDVLEDYRRSITLDAEFVRWFWYNYADAALKVNSSLSVGGLLFSRFKQQAQ